MSTLPTVRPEAWKLSSTVLAFLVLLVSLGASPRATAQGEPAREGSAKAIVVHIGQYSNDLHSAAMGLGLAGMLQEAGADVTVFLDREAVRLADAAHPLLTYGDTDVGSLLSSFLSGGGRVVVCPHCAELGGVEASELREGVVMGTRASIAQLFLGADTVIDY